MRVFGRIAAYMTGVGFLASFAGAGEIGHRMIAEIRMESYRNHLVNDLFAGLGMDRSCGDGPHGPLARDRVAEHFEKMGLEVIRQIFEAPNGPGENIIATLPGSVFPDTFYLVSAHIDNVANGGADDDASGVAALLELARVFSAYETDYSIRFIATDYEESGLRGAIAYCTAFDSDNVLGVINIDMIAWNSGYDECRLFSSPQSLELKNALADSFGAYQTGVTATVAEEMPFGTSDHAVFEYFGYQALVVMERNYAGNPYLHNFRDTIDLPGYPHYDFATKIVRGIAGFLADYAGARPPGDCNGNGESDEIEIQNHPALDCNGNFILDECEFAGDLDVNTNGVPDLCDIWNGTSGDCNGNWIPDEAETAYGEDCNENGVPDMCELADFSARDFNHNLIPDVCEGPGTIYVDDDASNDPGPNDPGISDPLEDGSLNHPYDTLEEALAAALEGDEIVLLPGDYTGAACQNLHMYAKAVTIRGLEGPRRCRLTPPLGSSLFVFDFLEGPETVLRDLTIADGSKSTRGIVYCDSSSPTFVNCIFEHNTVSRGAGGAVTLSNSFARFLNCLFAGNVAHGSIFGNGNGGAVGVVGGAPEFVNCTFVDNNADHFGGTLYVANSRIYITNSILHGGFAPNGAEIALDGAELTIGYSNLSAGPPAIWNSNSSIYWNQGNIGADPGFVRSNEGNYLLGPGSPCIDAGCNLALPPDRFDQDMDGDLLELLPLDLRAAGRFADDPDTIDVGCGGHPLVDMGAYEYGEDAMQPCLGDFNGDRVVNLDDLAQVLGVFGRTADGDLDCDGDTDLADLAILLGQYGISCL